MIKRRLLLIWAMVALVGMARAEWTDVTSSYITNSNFSEGNPNGWQASGGYTVRSNCMEWWNKSNFVLRQYLSNLPKGHYRLSVQGYHRLGGPDAAYQRWQNTGETAQAVLYVGEQQQLLANYFERDFEPTATNNWCSVNGLFYPNTMETAEETFKQGAYLTSIEFDADGGDIPIGIEFNYWDYDNSRYISENWCIFSNFKLETTSQVVLAESVTFSLAPTLVIGHSTQAQYTVKPDNVSQKSLQWTSSDEHVAVVDNNGQVTGVGLGLATITAKTIDGSALSHAADIAIVADAQAEWNDVTNIFLKNPSFDNDNIDYWNREVYAQGNDVRLNAMEVYNGTFNISQKLKGLPQGQYRLSVQGYYRAGNNVNGSGNSFNLNQLEEGDYFSGAFADYWYQSEQLTAYLYGGNEQQPMASVYSASLNDYVSGSFYTYHNEWNSELEQYTATDYTFYPNNMEGGVTAFQEGKYWNSVEFDAEGETTIGIANETYVNSNWCMFDNFKLEFKGKVVNCTGVKLSLENTELVVDQIVQIQAEVTPANALQKMLKWTSSNPDAVFVDQEGVIVAWKEGTAVITATTIDGSNISNSITVKVSRPTVTGTSFVINEIMASNVDEYVSPAYNFDGWMELYNLSGTAMTLTGLYLSDDAQNLKKWKIPASVGVLPAKGYKVIWFDSNGIAQQNAPFKLDTDGGMLYVSDASGGEMIRFQYPASKERVSYARTVDGGDTWGYTATATPGASNNGSTFATTQLQAPVVDQPSQLFTTPLSVNVTIPAGQTLRYTTDGTLPTADNGMTSTTGQFSVSGTANYRFRLFADGMLPSDVTTRSYIYRDRDYYLPVVSVVSDPRFLYDDQLGVYVRGKNGRPGNGQSSACNWNMDWERPVNLSYLTGDGEMVLNQDVNLEMCGGWSRAWTPHSFKLKGSKELGGDKNLPYPFFTQKPYIRNRTLQIRNGGNDNNGRFKDPSLQYIAQTSGIDLDCQSYQPVHEFINGEYIGVLNVREPNNKHFVYANFGWDDDEIDQFEMSPDSGYVQRCGTPDAFNELVDVLSPDAANSETYAEICRVLDIDNYINYMAAEFYLGGNDWPQNNVKGYKLRDGGRFRFVVFDLDGTFATSDPFNSFMKKETYTFDPLYPTSLGRITDHIRFVTLFKNLLKNADFRRKFIDTYCLMGGSVFEANRAADIIENLRSRVEPAMALEGRQWNMNNTANDVRNALNGRLQTANNALRNYSTFNLGSVSAQQVQLKSDAEDAQLLINGLQVPTGQFNGYLYAPVQLKAEAPAGYAFQGWLSGTSGASLKDAGTQWSYYDQGSLDGQNWTSPTYAESNWQKGNAPLGYGKNSVVTTLDYGSNSQQKRPTAYFRTSVQLAQAPKSSDEFTLNYTIDDGFIIYVNGAEAGRYNMPSGAVAYSTYATSYAQNNPDAGSMQLEASLFHQGNNVIAVEVHNNSATSTDLLWDASLYTTAEQQTPTFYSTEQEISLPQGNSVSLKASYRELTQAERQQQGISAVRINEVSGSNDSYIDEYGKKGDWLELYNTTNQEIDVEGMYLTDNLDKPEKYMITKGKTNAKTKIPAHGHLIIWCDNKRATTDQGLHANFKIDGDGGVLQLMAADKSWKDNIYYDAHDANTTVGRYPDGAASVYNMNVATIAQANRLSSYAEQTDQEALKQQYGQTGMKPTLASTANGFRIRYGAQQLIVKGEDDGPVVVELFTSDGRLVERKGVVLHSGTARIDVSHLPQGFFVARATADQQTRVACKFMK